MAEKVRFIKNQIIAVVLSAILFAGIITGLIYALLNIGKEITPVEAGSIVTQTQAINGADKNISFEFSSGGNVTKDNFREYISIRDMSGNSAECKFVSGANDRFTVKAPDGGYKSGGTYIITVNNEPQSGFGQRLFWWR